jgi:hypothetical protein
MQIINWLTSDPTHITTALTIIATVLSFMPGKVGEIGKRIGVNVTKNKAAVVAPKEEAQS